MPPKSRSTLKRKRGHNSGTDDFKEDGSTLASSAFAQPLWAAEEHELFEVEIVSAARSMVYRAALVKSPEASCAVLSKHRALVDPDLVKMLEIVADYEVEVIPLSSSGCAMLNLMLKRAKIACTK